MTDGTKTTYSPIDRLQKAFCLIQDVMDLLPAKSRAYTAAQETMLDIETLMWEEEQERE